MQARFGQQTWSLVVPAGWEARRDPECASLAADREVGVLQISAAFKDSEVLDSDLRDFAAEHLEAGAEVCQAQAGEFVGFEITYGDEEFFWREWYLRNGHQMLFVTYNCALESRGLEDEVVDGILASLTASDVA